MSHTTEVITAGLPEVTWGGHVKVHIYHVMFLVMQLLLGMMLAFVIGKFLPSLCLFPIDPPRGP